MSLIKCPKCNTEFESLGKWGHRKFCSRKCANSHVRTEESKKKTSESCKNSQKFQDSCKNINSNKKRSIKAKINWIRKSDEEKIQQIQRLSNSDNGVKKGYIRKRNSDGYAWSFETRNKLSVAAKIRYKLNPELHPNKLCAGLKESYPEKMVREYLESNNLIKNDHFIQQHNIFRYYVDFYFPKLNLCLEVDGEHWHKDVEKDLIRENKIKEISNVIRFKAKDVTRKKHENDLNQIINAIIAPM